MSVRFNLPGRARAETKMAAEAADMHEMKSSACTMLFYSTERIKKYIFEKE